MHVLHSGLFSFQEFVNFVENQDTVCQLLAAIDTSVIARKFLPNWTGRPMYNRSAIFKAIVLKEILQIPTIESLIIVLAHSESFSYWCGFDITRRLPSATVFYRFHAELVQDEELGKLFSGICSDLVGKIAQNVDIKEAAIIIDSTDISSRERPPAGKDEKVRREHCEKFGSAWGYRTASTGETEQYFGYKSHVAVAVTDAGVIPVALRLAPANVADVKVATDGLIVDAIQSFRDLFGKRPDYLIADAGYDASEVYHQALSYGCQPIIKLNKRRLSKLPAAMTENGVPLCPANRPMTFWGYEKERQTLKYRCPAVVGKEECSQKCCQPNSYGLIKRIKITTNPRIFSNPPRGSEKWQQLYNLRSSVERWFAVMKDYLHLDRMTRRGIQKAYIDVMLKVIAYLATIVVRINMTEKTAAAA